LVCRHEQKPTAISVDRCKLLAICAPWYVMEQAPRSKYKPKLPQGSKPSLAAARIFVSVAAHGSVFHQLSLLVQIDRSLEPSATALHVSQGSKSPTELPSRVVLNPEHLNVSWCKPTILLAHVSNWRLLFKVAATANDKVVLLASNQHIFRSCRETVMAHDMGLAPGLENMAFPHLQHTMLGFPSARWRTIQQRIHSNLDDWMGQYCWNQWPFMHSMQTAPPNGWKPTQRMFSPHEGTFYPVWLLQAFMARIVHGSDSMSAFGEDCSSPGYTKCMGCPEETLLPTFVWQEFPFLFKRASPPIVVLTRSPDEVGASNFVHKMVYRHSCLKHVCAVKTPSINSHQPCPWMCRLGSGTLSQIPAPNTCVVPNISSVANPCDETPRNR
jgi:hypothetical protein